MRNEFFLILLAAALTACNSESFVVESSSDDVSRSSITVADESREALTLIPDISFNGSYENTASTELGIGDGLAVSESDGDAATASSPSDSSGGRVADTSIFRPPSNQSIEPGTLTAGDYDDHLNPFLYQIYAKDYLQRRGQWIDIPRLDFNNRIRIEVTDSAGQAYPNAVVEIDSQPMITLQTAADGITSLYTTLDQLPDNFKLRVTGSDGTTVQQDINRRQAADAGKILVTLSTGDQTSTDQGQSNSSLATSVDLMFVIDTTGSMADELNFLQTELSDIINSITVQQSDIKIGLVFYRDYGDSYIVQAQPFSDNLNAVQLNLNQEQAQGGGDYPEAMDQALQAAIGSDWRTASRKVLFLIADAPPHSDRMRATWNAAEQARLKNVHIVPVAASGVAEDAEYIMRSVAALTNSRYLFLTDDSGYGLSHAEPEIDCYIVTSLRQAMIRALNTLVTGRRVEPSENDVIRRVGSQNNGVCDKADQSNQPAFSVLVDKTFPVNGTITQQRAEVITSQDSLDSELALYGEASVSADFDSGQVLLIDMGQRSTGGYIIELASFEEHHDHVVANLVFRQPGDNCAVTEALTNPYMFVYVATQKEVRVSEKSVTTDCSAGVF